MKVLLAHRYFWPDTPPYASILRDIAGELVANDFEVEVFTAQPSYGGSDRHDKTLRREFLPEGTHVRRARLLTESRSSTSRRIVNLVWFAAQLGTRILRGRYDVVMIATTPPVLVGLVGVVTGRLAGSRTVYHMQDIWPDVAEDRLPALAARILRVLDSFTIRAASRVVVLSSDMAATVQSRGASTSKIRTINNFVPEHSTSAVSAVSTATAGRHQFRLIFAGNLGSFQGLGAVIQAVAQINDHRLTLLFVGDGADESNLRELAERIAPGRISFTGRVTAAEAATKVEASDLGIVSLRPGLIRAAYPSKTFTYLSKGTPLLAAVDRDSELAEVIEKERLGFVCSPGDVDSVADAIGAALSLTAAERADMRERCVAYARNQTSRSHRLADWREMFEELSAS